MHARKFDSEVPAAAAQEFDGMATHGRPAPARDMSLQPANITQEATATQPYASISDIRCFKSDLGQYETRSAADHSVA